MQNKKLNNKILSIYNTGWFRETVQTIYRGARLSTEQENDIIHEALITIFEFKNWNTIITEATIKKIYIRILLNWRNSTKSYYHRSIKSKQDYIIPEQQIIPQDSTDTFEDFIATLPPRYKIFYKLYYERIIQKITYKEFAKRLNCSVSLLKKNFKSLKDYIKENYKHDKF